MHNKDNNNNDEPDRYYIVNINLNYYKLKPYNEPEESQINFTELIIYNCCFCCNTFILNNKLY